MHLFLMNVEIFGELAHRFVQVSQLALQVGRVVASLVHAHNGQTSLLEAIALLLERDYSVTKQHGQMMNFSDLLTSAIIFHDGTLVTYSWRCLGDS